MSINIFNAFKTKSIPNSFTGDFGIDSKNNLSQSKQFLDNNEYVSAMFALQSPYQSNLLWVIPIITIIVLLLIIKIKFNKTKKQSLKKKEKIINYWKD